MATLKIFILVLVVSLTDGTYGKAPGLKSRITSKGLNYAVNVALDALTKDLTSKQIPDQHGKSGHVSYDVTKMRITKFTKPQSTISMIPNSGISWRTTGIGIGLHGDFHYKYKQGIIKISDHGSFDLNAGGISLQIRLIIGMDSSGRPTISSSSCSCSVQSTSIKFHGGRAWIYNLFRGKVAKTLKSSIEGGNGLLCKQLTKLVNVDGAKKMAKLPVEVKLAKKFLLDYSFLAKPSFQTNFMETFHKGEVDWLQGPKNTPIIAPKLPTGTDTSRMLYIWLSDFLFNTMSYSAFSHDMLKYNVTDKNIPGDVLNTTCKLTCIGNLIPQIGKMFPNSKVMLNLRSTAMPNMTASNGTTKVEAVGDIKFYAMTPTNKDVYFLTLSANMSTTISVTVEDEKVYAKVIKLPIKIRVKESKIGPLSDSMLNFIVQKIVTVFVEPKLNDLGKNGFPLPIIASVKFVNTQLKLQQNSLLIATDLKYTG
ncbi:lipopolysaccharide-binding protein-like [Saccostrea cucullata]|uniref:lipopolysaccharide-binding protein-like n=1 Tax=Saccostrea cuccullata TaxID=36930 RepID=UPI002ED57090